MNVGIEQNGIFFQKDVDLDIGPWRMNFTCKINKIHSIELVFVYTMTLHTIIMFIFILVANIWINKWENGQKPDIFRFDLDI